MADGKATGIETIVCTSVREPDGTFNPQYDASCSALSLQADSIIVAIGQTSDQLLNDAVPAKPRKVNSGGDMATGPSTVIQAIASARDAVAAIESYLSKNKPAAEPIGRAVDFVASNFETIPRITISELSPSERVKGIDLEDIPGHSIGEIQAEARRCFNCGCLAVAPSDVAVALVALDARIATTKRTLSAENFFTAGASSSTVLDPDELIKEIRIPAPPAGVRQTYRKFTLRQPVDFAIVSVASVLTLSDGVYKDARIVLGAVAPAPIRLRGAEELVKGQPVGDKEAAEIAKQALANARPLAKNEYKVEIAKALVKQAIVG